MTTIAWVDFVTIRHRTKDGVGTEPAKTYHGEDINKKNVKNLLTNQSKNVIINHKLKIVEKKGLKL